MKESLTQPKSTQMTQMVQKIILVKMITKFDSVISIFFPNDFLKFIPKPKIILGHLVTWCARIL